MTLAEFLTARISEDEAWARSYARLLNETQMNNASTPEHERASVAFVFGQEHLHPDRLLREAEAKRKILERHGPHETAFDGLACDWCSEDVDDGPQLAKERWPCGDIRALAAIYADHPGYLEEWRHETP